MNTLISTESVWTQYHNILYNFVLSRVSDKATTEDILQDVFQKIHTRMHTLRENDKIQSLFPTERINVLSLSESIIR